MRINKNNWLSGQTEKELNSILDLKVQDEILNKFKNLINFTKGTSSIWLILPLLIVIYVLASFNFTFYNLIIIPLSKEQATSLLNNRITNIVTIFSVSVAIFIFIVNSLKDIRRGEDIFKLTLQETYFYPVLYYSISLIAINYFVSFLVNSNAIHDDIYIRFSVLFMWLCVIQCSLIGYSFYLVYKAYDNDYIINKYHSLIEKEIQTIIKKELKERLSYNIYRKTIESINGLVVGYINTKENKYILNFNLRENMRITDINMRLLTKILSVKEITGTFVILRLNDILYKYTPVFGVFNELVAKKLNKKYRSIFTLKKIKNEKDFLKELKNNLKRNGESAIYSNDEVSFRSILDIHEKIHIYVIVLLKKYQYEEKLDLYPSTNFFDTGINVIDRDHIGIYNYFEKAILKENKEIIHEILLFIYNLYVESLNNKSIILVEKYKYVYIWMYKKILSQGNLKKFFVDKMCLHLNEFTTMFLDIEFNRLTDYKLKYKILMFYGRVYFTISEILYQAIKNDDKDSYRRIIEYFNSVSDRYEYEYNIDDLVEDEEVTTSQNEKKLKNASFELYYLMFQGIRSWLIELYRSEKLNIESFNWYYEKIPHLYKSGEKILINISEYSYSSRGELYNFSEWGNDIERIPLQAYTPDYNPTSWLTFSGIIDLISNNYPNSNDIDEIPLKSSLRYFSNRVNEVCDILLNNYEKWNSIFHWAISEDKYKIRVNRIKDNMLRLKERFDFEEYEKKSKQELSIDKINLFKEGIYKTWKPFTLVNNLFKTNINLNIVTNRVTKSLRIERNGKRFKMMFIDEGYQKIFGTEHYGGDLTRFEKIEFMKVILQVKKDINKYSNIVELLDSELEIFEKNDKKANLIFFCDRVYGVYKELSENSNYSHYYEHSRGKRVAGFQGAYKGIPIYYLGNDKYKNKIIICNFDKSFCANVNTNENWLGGYLNVEVREMSDVEIDNEIVEIKKNDYNEDDYKDSSGNPLNDENLKIKLRNDIKMIFEEKIEFVVIDSSEFLISELNHSKSTKNNS